jgi:hypothetical protein
MRKLMPPLISNIKSRQYDMELWKKETEATDGKSGIESDK